jgi:hypothetical protein
MFKTTMEVDAALGAVWQMPRGNLVNSLVRSLVRTCIRTAGQSQRVAAARAAARAVAARTTIASGQVSLPRTAARSTVAATMPHPIGVTARPRAAAAVPVSMPVSQPAFARVSSRRDAQPATLNPVRIYSTPSRTVMVGNLSEVARFLDDSIERERSRLAARVQTGPIQAAAAI